MNFQRIIKAAVAFIAITQSAIAEPSSHNLHAYKYWATDFVSGSNGEWCMAHTKKNNGGSLSINATRDTVEIQIYVPQRNWRSSYGSLSFKIDNRAPWTTSDAHYYRQSIFTPNLKTQVLKELAYGNNIHLYNNAGEYVESYSLAGSRAAIIALNDCVGKLGTTKAHW